MISFYQWPSHFANLHFTAFWRAQELANGICNLRFMTVVLGSKTGAKCL